MTVTLDAKLTVGDVTVATLVDCSVATTHFGRSAMCQGHKRPVAILFGRGAARCAVSPEGSPLTQADIEALCPGAWQAFMR